MPAIVVKWLINAYVDTVPEETVLRVWDCLFSEDWKVITHAYTHTCTPRGQYSDYMIRCMCMCV